MPLTSRTLLFVALFFFFSSRRRHTILVSDWSSDVCSSDLFCFKILHQLGITLEQFQSCAGWSCGHSILANTLGKPVSAALKLFQGNSQLVQDLKAKVAVRSLKIGKGSCRGRE